MSGGAWSEEDKSRSGREGVCTFAFGLLQWSSAGEEESGGEYSAHVVSSPPKQAGTVKYEGDLVSSTSGTSSKADGRTAALFADSACLRFSPSLA